MQNKQFKTRFAPSPTGFPHLGNIRSALMPYLFIRKNQGKFLLRIDDTDKTRYEKRFEDAIFDYLNWLEIDYDYTFKQSNRFDLYNKYFEILKSKNRIYECFETNDELELLRRDKKNRNLPFVFTQDMRINKSGQNGYWRFDLEKDKFEIFDENHGLTVFGRDWSDPIIRKPDGSYSYLFASVADDIEENITYIIRGEDHKANGAMQNELGSAILGHKWDIKYIHFPMILDNTGHKLSKRNESLNLDHMRNDSIEKWAIWALLFPSRNVISCKKQDYIDNFDQRIANSLQKIDFDTLQILNKKILNLLPDSEIIKHTKHLAIWHLLRENIKNIKEYLSYEKKILDFNYNNSKFIDFFTQNVTSDTISKMITDVAEKYAKTLGKKKSEVITEVYFEILGVRFGPPLRDLILVLKNLSK